MRRTSNLTSSACEGVRPDVRGCGLRGRPVGIRKRRLLPLPVPWMLAWVPVWMTGVHGRRVVSSRGATNKGEDMSVQVCPMKDPVKSQEVCSRGGQCLALGANHDRVKSPSSSCRCHEGVPRAQPPENSDSEGRVRQRRTVHLEEQFASIALSCQVRRSKSMFFCFVRPWRIIVGGV